MTGGQVSARCAIRVEAVDTPTGFEDAAETVYRALAALDPDEHADLTPVEPYGHVDGVFEHRAWLHPSDEAHPSVYGVVIATQGAAL